MPPFAGGPSKCPPGICDADTFLYGQDPFLESVPGQKRKLRTTLLMSVKRPKAEVAHTMRDVRKVPIGDIREAISIGKIKRGFDLQSDFNVSVHEVSDTSDNHHMAISILRGIIRSSILSGEPGGKTN